MEPIGSARMTVAMSEDAASLDDALAAISAAEERILLDCGPTRKQEASCVTR
jgi:hypothetical protein